MIKIKSATKEYDATFTFNSFRYMQDFDVSVFDDIDQKPFKIIGVLDQLLSGALNYNKSIKVSHQEVEECIEYIFENGDAVDTITELMTELEGCNFFSKALQQKKTPREKK